MIFLEVLHYSHGMLTEREGSVIDLKRITRCNLRIVRVGHFWKCYGSEASKFKKKLSRSFEVIEIIAFFPFKEKLLMITV